ncbi:MAG: hypothetical protein CMN73_05360 [Sphingomonas sp.]|nr:hypothetical protein [Sphingomonas sp.]|tara:strand:- start:1635 stop:2213 length:579 start_codon:yes stop_codon:yes gene_type:complete
MRRIHTVLFPAVLALGFAAIPAAAQDAPAEEATTPTAAEVEAEAEAPAPEAIETTEVVETAVETPDAPVVAEGPVPAPPAGMGQIVFYRTGGLVGAAISCRVREGETVVNRLPPGKYFVYATTPGPHEFNVRSEARDNLRLEVEEGETQYVRCTVRMGIMAGRPNLAPADAADFADRVAKLDKLPPYTGDND